MFCRFHVSCSSHRNYTLRRASLMYVCSQTHTPSYMTHPECGFLFFSLNSYLTFFIIYFILFPYELLVSSWNLLMKQNGNSVKTNYLGISKKSKGIVLSSWLLLLHFSLKCLMTQFTNLGGITSIQKTFI